MTRPVYAMRRYSLTPAKGPMQADAMYQAETGSLHRDSIAYYQIRLDAAAEEPVGAVGRRLADAAR